MNNVDVGVQNLERRNFMKDKRKTIFGRKI